MTLTQVIEAAKKALKCDIIVQYRGGVWTAFKNKSAVKDICCVSQDELVRKLLSWAALDEDPDDISNVRSVALDTLMEVNNVLTSAGWVDTGRALVATVRTAISQTAAQERIAGHLAAEAAEPKPAKKHKTRSN